MQCRFLFQSAWFHTHVAVMSEPLTHHSKHSLCSHIYMLARSSLSPCMRYSCLHQIRTYQRLNPMTFTRVRTGAQRGHVAAHAEHCGAIVPGHHGVRTGTAGRSVFARGHPLLDGRFHLIQSKFVHCMHSMIFMTSIHITRSHALT